MKNLLLLLSPSIRREIKLLKEQNKLLLDKNSELIRRARAEREARYDAEEMSRTIENQLVEYYEGKLIKLKQRNNEKV